MLGFLEGFMQQDMETNRLEELKKQFKTSSSLKLKKCNKCGFCCHKRACIPTPEEVKKVANFFKLSPNQLINTYYAIDRQTISNKYYVKPIGINQKDLIGKFIPGNRTYNEGQCIFLDRNNLCKIYLVRPQSAKNQKCWSNERFENAIDSWGDNELKTKFGIEVSEFET